MINSNFLKNILSQTPKLPRSCQKGFTLIELLVSIVIGSLIVTAILGIMTDLIRASREEEVRIETQRDMQKALSFIENELKSAVYLYTGEDLATSNRGAPPLLDFLDLNSDYKVILAFWKPEVIPYTPAGPAVPQTCTNVAGDALNGNLDAADASIEECEELLIERRTYTLVVYVQDTDPTSTWSGETVIRRFAMRKYDAEAKFGGGDGFLTLTRTENPSNQDIYIDPAKEAKGFRLWPIAPDGTTNLQAGIGKPKINGNTAPVLVDFVDDDNPASPPSNLPTCLDEDDITSDNLLQVAEDDPSNGGNGNGVLDVYIPTPLNTGTGQPDSTSFFACVRQSFLQGDVSEGNQDVILYLRGNPTGRSGFEANPNSYKPLPTVQSRVVLRGVVDKLFSK